MGAPIKRMGIMKEAEYHEIEYWGWECPDPKCGHWNETQDDPSYNETVMCEKCCEDFLPVPG
jgi:hypothetical protein